MTNHDTTIVAEFNMRILATLDEHEAAARRHLPGGRLLAEMWAELDDGAALFSAVRNAPVPRVAVENPVMHRYAKERIANYQPPAQTVQPWWFGDPAFKATGLYLRGLPPLVPTNRLTPPKPGTEGHKDWSRVHRMPPGPERWKERSRTYQGIADAMAEQWGGWAIEKEAA
jgi:hypothetical protein